MKKNEKEFYIGKISGYYLELVTEEEAKKINHAFRYFNNNVMIFIIEERFKNNRSIRYIEQHCEMKLSKSSINNYINIFIDQLRYEFK